MAGVRVLVCKVCGREFERGCLGGGPPLCCGPECRTEYVRERNRLYREGNTERQREYMRIYRQTNAEKERERHRRYYEADSRGIRERTRLYYEANKETAREQKRVWHNANPERGRAYRHRRRALKRGAEGRHTADDLRALATAQTPRGKTHPACWWCGKDTAGKYHVDHRIPLSRGGGNSPDNLVISCARCNLRKHAKMPQEFAGRLL
jgi:5-methylcytosine-specific restriction endonuclease McrA